MQRRVHIAAGTMARSSAILTSVLLGLFCLLFILPSVGTCAAAPTRAASNPGTPCTPSGSRTPRAAHSERGREGHVRVRLRVGRLV